MITANLTLPRLFTEGSGDLSVQLTLPTGELTAIVGPSGSGKTSLLRLLAGLETPATGHIEVDGVVWLDTMRGINRPPQQRSIGFVFQDTALFPHMTVRQNIRFAATNTGSLVDELIESVGLQSFVNNKPTTLSGGQRQRVALARALVRQPKLLLLDEPFAALDALASQQLRQTLLTLHQQWGTTTLLVTHHEADSQHLADRVIRLEQGRISSDQPVIPALTSQAIQEPILRVTFDEDTHTWVIETATSQLRTTNPAWKKLLVG